MPESEHAAGSWLGDLTNEWKHAKPPEKFLIVGAIIAVGGIAFYLYRKQNAGTVNAPSQNQGQGQGGQQSGIPTIPAGETPLLPAGINPIYDPNGNLVGYGPTPPSGTPAPSSGNPPPGSTGTGTGTTGTRPPPGNHHHRHHHKKHDNDSTVTRTAGQTNHRRRHIVPPRQANQGPGSGHTPTPPRVYSRSRAQRIAASSGNREVPH